jgi:hypothetical protein
VRGTVESYFGVNRINVATPSDVQVLSTNNTLPTAQNVFASDFRINKLGGDTTVKKWESVLLRLDHPVFITCINSQSGVTCLYQNPPLIDTAFRRNYGEIWISDNSNANAMVGLQDGNHTFTNNWDGNPNGRTLLYKNDSLLFLEGILYYSFSNYKLIPRRNFDFGTLIHVGIKNNEEVVNSYQLFQNYPNPFNPVTNIKFTIPELSNIKLVLYDVLGKEVQVLENRQLPEGSYTLTMYGLNLSSGIYFYRFEATGQSGRKFTDTHKMVLLK